MSDVDLKNLLRRAGEALADSEDDDTRALLVEIDAALRAPIPCPMCDGLGYSDDGSRETVVCLGCEGSGRGVPCACGSDVIPEAAPVSHESNPDDHEEQIHTRERCARHTPRDGWEVFGSPIAEGWESTEDGMPDWCEEYSDGNN